MISIHTHKDKRHAWLMRVLADGNPERLIISSGGTSPREAALWLLRNINKLAAEVEEQLVELGFLTEVECEATLAECEVAAVPEQPS